MSINVLRVLCVSDLGGAVVMGNAATLHISNQNCLELLPSGLMQARLYYQVWLPVCLLLPQVGNELANLGHRPKVLGMSGLSCPWPRVPIESSFLLDPSSFSLLVCCVGTHGRDKGPT